jgi:hypothetical protein
VRRRWGVRYLGGNLQHVCARSRIPLLLGHRAVGDDVATGGTVLVMDRLHDEAGVGLLSLLRYGQRSPSRTMWKPATRSGSACGHEVRRYAAVNRWISTYSMYAVSKTVGWWSIGAFLTGLRYCIKRLSCSPSTPDRASVIWPFRISAPRAFGARYSCSIRVSAQISSATEVTVIESAINDLTKKIDHGCHC